MEFELKTSSFELQIIGDGITDRFIEGHQIDKRFIPTKILERGGGATNTYQNAANILMDLDNIIIFYKSDPREITLTRLIENNQTILEFWNTTLKKPLPHLSYPTYVTQLIDSGLIVSDYNKGRVSVPKIINETTYWHCNYNWEFAVVDSRYRTVDLTLIKHAKVKIWHATGKEYDWEYAQHFDWVIHTNGPRDIWLGKVQSEYSGNRHDWAVVRVPTETPVVDVTGAGDTFTAAIGCFLAAVAYEKIDLKLLTEATKFAVWCCQEVIQKPYTTPTTYNLSEYINVHNKSR